jgi:protein involved in polysaccharide export with SLBB domain
MTMPRLKSIILAYAVLALCGASGPVRAQDRPAGPDDVRVGDRIILFVEGDRALTDSFTVSAGPAVVLPLLGSVSLVGVQRSDIEPYLTKEIGRLFRNPVIRVRIRGVMRLAIMGEVGKPGFYDISTEALLTDAINLAGGPTRDAKMKSAHVEREGKTIVESGSVQKALAGGVTLTQLGLRSGDQLLVPAGGSALRTMQVVAAIIAIPASLWFLFFRR